MGLCCLLFRSSKKAPADLAVDDLTSMKEECIAGLRKILNWKKGALLCFQQFCLNIARALHAATASLYDRQHASSISVLS